MEKKIEMQTKEGRIIRVLPHMVKDFQRFGATEARRTYKDPPEELKLGKKVPNLDLTPEPMKVPNPATQEISKQEPQNVILPKVRKKPVRSKK